MRHRRCRPLYGGPEPQAPDQTPCGQPSSDSRPLPRPASAGRCAGRGLSSDRRPRMKLYTQAVRVTKTFNVVAANEDDEVWQAAKTEEANHFIDEEDFEIL